MTPDQLEKIVSEVLSRRVLALVEASTEALTFLRHIEGHGYGGMSDYDCAVASLERALQTAATPEVAGASPSPQSLPGRPS